MVWKGFWESPSFVSFPTFSSQHHGGKSWVVEEKEKNPQTKKEHTMSSPKFPKYMRFKPRFCP